MSEIQLSTRVSPTEDRAKVAAAILSLFPDAVIEGDEVLRASSSSLESFSEQLAKQRIRAAARKILTRGVEGSKTTFRLNKQVATTGKVSFSEEEHPLGDITVTIRSLNIQSVIDELAPSSKGAP